MPIPCRVPQLYVVADEVNLLSVENKSGLLSDGNWTIDAALSLLGRLLQPGTVGTFNAFIVYEIVAIPKGESPLNILTVAVAEAIPGACLEQGPVVLNSERIRVDGFPDWTFCVARSVRSLDSVSLALRKLRKDRVWNLSGKSLDVGELRLSAPMFVPPDGTDVVPINAILKNNFWNGSHVLRFCDSDKTRLLPFFDDRRRLQQLSYEIGNLLPVKLTGVIDFLGDIIVQIPVTILQVNWGAGPNKGEVSISVAWHPDATPRELVGAARARFDTGLVAASVIEGFTHSTSLSMDTHDHPFETEVWDKSNGLLLAATASTSYIRQIVMTPHIVWPEPRVFTIPKQDGLVETARIQVGTHHRFVVGDTDVDPANDWRNRRTQLEEAARLAERREFVQYFGNSLPQSDRARALDDLRYLIRQHGAEGVDLWDPYLSAEDVLQTLFWSDSVDAPLRAITNGDEAKEQKSSGSAGFTYNEKQRSILQANCGNALGMNLEFRARSGPAGWSFHDRFLIFPNRADGPLAWSLGTSVNSLGKAHHILQKVSNAALIAGAFESLWLELNERHHFIWSSR